MLRNTKSGFMVMEIIMALVVLSFIIRPTFVEQESPWGERTTKIEWEMPMTQFLAYIGNFQNIIDRSWAGLDADFGYTGGHKADIAGLMQKTAVNAPALLTAGFVSNEGRFGSFDSAPANYENAIKGTVTAFYDAARQGMSN